MPVLTFGGGPSDVVVTNTSGALRAVGPAAGTLWDAAAGGTQYDAPAFRLGSEGRVPAVTVTVPEGVAEVWLQLEGVAGRFRLVAQADDAVDAAVAAAAQAEAALAEIPNTIAATVGPAVAAAVEEKVEDLDVPSVQEVDDLPEDHRGVKVAGDDVYGLRWSRDGRKVDLPTVSFHNLRRESGWLWAWLDESMRIIFGQRLDGSFYPSGIQDTPVYVPVTMVGDSLTQGRRLVADPALSARLPGNRRVNNIGMGGHYSTQIVGRLGSTPTLMTVQDNKIPASGTVAVTALTPWRGPENGGNIAGINGTGVVIFEGMLAGRLGRFTSNKISENPGVYERTFEPYEATAYATPCPPLTPFQMGFEHQHTWLVLALGRNNFEETGAAQIVAELEAALHWTDFRNRATILSIPPSAGDTPARRALLTATNDAVREAFSPLWLDTAAYLRSEETLLSKGITPTTQDLDDIAAGLTPTSFRGAGDPLHYNGFAHDAVNDLLIRNWTGRNFITETE